MNRKLKLDSTKAIAVCFVSVMVIGSLVAVALLPWVRIRRTEQLVEIGATPLHNALMDGAPLAEIKEAIDTNPADVDTVNWHLGRPIDLAVGNLRWDVVDLLLAQGASPDGQMEGSFPFNMTLLQLSAADGYPELTRILIAHDVDLLEKTADGKTALDLAQERGHDEVAGILREAIQRLGRENE